MRTRIVKVFPVALLFLAALMAGSGAAPALSGDLTDDLRTLAVCREGLARTVAFAESRTDLFNPAGKERNSMPSRGEKMELWAAWSAMLDYTSGLDTVAAGHADFMGYVSGKRKRSSFSLVYASFLAEYRYALEFIALAEKNPALEAILDEPVPEFGLPGGGYGRYKFRFLNVVRATEFAALLAVDKGLPGRDVKALRAAMGEDATVIKRMGTWKGPVLTFANGLSIVGKIGFSAWFPFQKGASEFMGDVKVRHIGKSFISQEQIRSLPSRLEPGDILLERREWYLSNLGLPGFWTHAALYVGTEAERRAFFNDPQVRQWVRAKGVADGDFEELLRRYYPTAYGRSVTPQEKNHLPRVLEAVSEGVSFTTLEHSAAADSLAALRPRLSRREKAEAILRAFHYSGRPYDFNFDFRTDSSLVCSELVYKVYEPAPGMSGVRFPLTQVMGRPVSTPNDMVRQFNEQFDTPGQQTDLIVFLDGSEKTNSAAEADVAEFRRSWQRPKWHILTRKSSDTKTGVSLAVRPEVKP
jgi:hypothetical protein